MFGSCYSRQAYLKLYQPVLTINEVEKLTNSIENPYDMIFFKDEEKICCILNTSQRIFNEVY